MTPEFALLFIGGWGYGFDALSGLADRVKNHGGARVVSVGALYESESGPGLAGFVAGLVTLLDSVSNPLTLAGWSLGGLVALGGALQRPHRVNRLVLIGSTPRFIQGSVGPPGVPSSEFRAIRAALRRDPAKTLTAFRARAALPGVPSGPWSYPDNTVLAQGLETLAQSDFRAELSTITVPLALLHGEKDAIIPVSASAWMCQAARRASLTRIPEGGHDLPVSAPDLVADFLGRHLERGRGDGPPRKEMSGHQARRASVRARFSRASKTYEQRAQVQSAAAEGVMARLPAGFFPRRILDAGCGTGLLTRRLAEHFPLASITGVDLSESMLCAAREKTPDRRIQWIAADLLDWTPEKPFDLVASSSALHWLFPAVRIGERIRFWLRPGGRLVAAVMVRGTLGELHAIRAEVAPRKTPAAPLPAADEFRQALESGGLHIHRLTVEKLETCVPSVEALFHQLRSQGLTGGHLSRGTVFLNRGEISRMVSAYRRCYALPSGAVRATYVVAFVHAQNPL